MTRRHCDNAEIVGRVGMFNFAGYAHARGRSCLVKCTAAAVAPA